MQRHNPIGVNKQCRGCGRYFSAGLDGNYLCPPCSLRAAEAERRQAAEGGSARKGDGARGSAAPPAADGNIWAAGQAA